MSKERYAEHTIAWELPNGYSVTKGNYNLADIETKHIPIQTEIISDNKDKTIAELQQRIAELEEQLKEKDNEHAKEMMAFEKKCQAYYNSKGFAIEQLEKVKARFNGKRPIDEMANDVGVELGYTATQIQNYIENLQCQLKDLQKNEKVFSRGEEE